MSQRPPLPLVRTHHSGRSAMTCLYRCGNACDHPAPNESDNPYFGDIANAASRRGLLRAGLLGAITLGVGGSALAGATLANAEETATTAGSPTAPPPSGGALTFKPIPPNQLDAFIVPNGYDHAVVLRWGDPVLRGAPPFDPHHQTAAAQARQFGYNNDFVAVLPLRSHGHHRALLVVNHEYTNEELMFPGFTSLDALTVEQLRVGIEAHGMSIVEIERVGETGQWVPVRHGIRRYNRRITRYTTRFGFTGTAAGHELLRTADDPTGRAVWGTFNNCAGGVTPWGTVLSGEENFNQYFVGGDGAPEALKPSLRRYGLDTAVRYPTGNRKWDRADERFDLARHPQEAHRFGWIVELDPYEPWSAPRKHTALGRFKHEAATTILARDGRVVVYMGDDERFDYLYKFVSDKRFDPSGSERARRHNLTLLESGTLYVARLSFTSAAEIDGRGLLPGDGAFDGAGQWIPLVRGGTSLVPGMSAAEVLVFTRQAADLAGATKMDRPEDVEANPRTGKVYAAFTNNSRRGAAGQPRADEANPRNDNRHGHIMEITEAGGDNAAETFTWNLPIVCGDPTQENTYFAGFDKTKVSPISCPDNLAFDPAGNLWISTDGNALGSNDGLFAVALEGPERGHVKQFLTVPFGAETCGPVLTDDKRSVFSAVQHPGEIAGATWDRPASTWPDGDHAKPGVVCVWRLDGRAVGT